MEQTEMILNKLEALQIAYLDEMNDNSCERPIDVIDDVFQVGVAIRSIKQIQERRTLKR